LDHFHRGLFISTFQELPWSTLADQFPEPLLLIQAGGVVLFANREARRVFGYDDDSLAGLDVETLIPDEFHATHARLREDYLQRPAVRGTVSRKVSIFGRRRDGTSFPADVRLAPIQAPGGLIIAATVHDASEHRLVEATLSAARDVADVSNLGKSRFLAAVSHDLRQPIQALLLLNMAMRRHAVSPQIEDMLLEEERALEAISALVGKVLNVSKLESGTVEPKFEPVAMAAVLDDVRAAFERAAAAKGLVLELVPCADYVRTDKTLLLQLLDNLVANAIKYTDRGQVRVSTSRLDDWVTVAVEDCGLGIPARDLPHIFEDFRQIDRPGQERRGGLGLGLGTVRRIAELLRVEVQVSSQVNVGSRFSMHLPVVAKPIQAAVMAALQPEAFGSVFLIEDDAAVRRALTLLLKVEGFDVDGVGTLAEVATRLAWMSAPPTVLISDFHLGGPDLGTDGISLVRDWFKASIPAVILTGDTSAVALELSGLRHVVLLNKPVVAAALFDAMRQVCAAG